MVSQQYQGKPLHEITRNNYNIEQKMKMAMNQQCLPNKRGKRANRHTFSLKKQVQMYKKVESRTLQMLKAQNLRSSVTRLLLSFNPIFIIIDYKMRSHHRHQSRQVGDQAATTLGGITRIQLRRVMAISNRMLFCRAFQGSKITALIRAILKLQKNSRLEITRDLRIKFTE